MTYLLGWALTGGAFTVAALVLLAALLPPLTHEQKVRLWESRLQRPLTANERVRLHFADDLRHEH